MISSIAYSYLLSIKEPDNGTLHIPVINVIKEEIYIRKEVVWILEQNKIELNRLIFIEDIQLLLNNPNIHIILVDHNKLTNKLEPLNDKVIEIIDHHVDENQCSKAKKKIERAAEIIKRQRKVVEDEGYKVKASAEAQEMEHEPTGEQEEPYQQVALNEPTNEGLTWDDAAVRIDQECQAIQARARREFRRGQRRSNFELTARLSQIEVDEAAGVYEPKNIWLTADDDRTTQLAGCRFARTLAGARSADFALALAEQEELIRHAIMAAGWRGSESPHFG